MSGANLLDAIAVVIQNERTASDSYAEAAEIIRNPIGKELFKQLSKFEQYHFELVTQLEQTLREQGTYLAYEGTEFPLPPIFEIEAAKELNLKSAMEIITQAMDLEQQAEKSYSDLADKIDDSLGHDTFVRLAGEEKKHYLILRAAYWSLTNQGTWQWVHA
jgi:hypothetical protein